MLVFDKLDNAYTYSGELLFFKKMHQAGIEYAHLPHYIHSWSDLHIYKYIMTIKFTTAKIVIILHIYLYKKK